LKSQTDMIVAIVAVLLALIAAGILYATRRTPSPVPAPEKVNVSAPQYPAGSVVYANGLSGSGGQGGVGGRSAGGGGAVGNGGFATASAGVVGAGGGGVMSGPAGMGSKGGGQANAMGAESN
jgi:hypothetical protein